MKQTHVPISRPPDDQAVTGEMMAKAWPVVWSEVLSMLLASGQAPLASSVVTALMTAGVRSEVLYTFMDRADRATERKERRPTELTLQHALDQ